MSKPSVLITEDDKPNAEWMRMVLAKQDYFDWDLVEGATEALADWCAARRDGRPFDLIVLDWHMPGRDGFAVARQIREEDATVRMVLLTAFHEPGDDHKIEMAGLGIEALWTKPEGSLEIVDLVRKTLKIPEAEAI